MNFLKNLFTKNNNVVDFNDTGTLIEEPFKDPGFENLFKDDTPPEAEFKMKSKNSLKSFFERNFFKPGFDAGYEFHNSQAMECGMKNIQSEFFHLISELIEERENEIYSMEIQKIQNAGFDTLLQQFDVRIKTIRESIEKFKTDVELSKQRKGFIEFPINKFKEGFEKGMYQYFNEEYIMRSTGMLN